MTAFNTPRYVPEIDCLSVSFEGGEHVVASYCRGVSVLKDANRRVIGVEIYFVSKIIADAEEAAANYVPDPKTEGMDFEQYMAWTLKNRPPEPFVPAIPFYNIDGDLLELYFTNEMPYAESHAGGVTVMRGQESKEIVGVLIHRVKQLIEKANEQQSTDA